MEYKFIEEILYEVEADSEQEAWDLIGGDNWKEYIVKRETWGPQ